jgi:site-specific recombinase XerD
MDERFYPLTVLAAETLPAHSTDKNVRAHLTRYQCWLADTGRALYPPELGAYRDHLAQRLAPASVRAHLAHVRRSYQVWLDHPAFRERLLAALHQQFPHDDFANRKAKADELELRVRRALDPQQARVTVSKTQDEADSQHRRLSPAQGAALLMQPDVTTQRGRRDVALLALLLATGIREGEAVALAVEDLYQTYGGVAALRVRAGKGAKARLVPFGDMLWARRIAAVWLDGRTTGALFTAMGDGRGDRHVERVTTARMTTRSVQRTLRRYPLAIEGVPTWVTPHDLRRSYARNLFMAGIPIEVIRQNLGHADVKTTQAYIGILDGATRAPVSVYDVSTVLERLRQYETSGD